MRRTVLHRAAAGLDGFRLYPAIGVEPGVELVISVRTHRVGFAAAGVAGIHTRFNRENE